MLSTTSKYFCISPVLFSIIPLANINKQFFFFLFISLLLINRAEEIKRVMQLELSTSVVHELTDVDLDQFLTFTHMNAVDLPTARPQGSYNLVYSIFEPEFGCFVIASLALYALRADTVSKL